MSHRAKWQSLVVRISVVAIMLVAGWLIDGAAPCLAADQPPAAAQPAVVPLAVTPAAAQPVATPAPAPAPTGFFDDLATRSSLTDHFFGLGKAASDAGVDVSLGLTQAYQQVLNGGTSVHNKAGRYAGLYELEVNFHLEQLLGIQGGRIRSLTFGSWSSGVDPHAVGSLTGVNNWAFGDHSVWVEQLYYEQMFLNNKVFVRVGKIDLTDGFRMCDCPVAFDGNSYANNKFEQFVNGALVDNPTIPFPQPGLAAVVHVQPLEWWYVSMAAADGRGQFRTNGLDTTFDDDARIFSLYETGVTPRMPSCHGPLQGAYRIGFWNDQGSRRDLDGTGISNNNFGLYVSCDQKLWNENDTKDGQGLGAFFRWGTDNADAYAIKGFWSAGLQYQGLIPSRDKDVTGLGFASSRLADSPLAGFTQNNESVVEAYYNIMLTPWCQIIPDIQYVAHPGGGATSDATVIGLRVQINF